MGKPAARMGDTTAHGGSIILGTPLVLIGKMPASALGDMHVCPMCTPAVPPIPHVGGPILMGSTGVLIGKKPAARVSDPTLCVGPPSMPAMGCMTVLLGEAGSGSQASSAGAAAAALAAMKKGPKAIEPFPIAAPPEKPPEIHTVECEFVDSAGKPLSGIPYKIKDPDSKDIIGVSTSDGKAYHGGYIKAGSFSVEVPAISEVKWAKTKAGVKDKVKYSAKIEGYDEGTPAFVTIIEEAGTLNRMLEFLPCKVSGGKIEGEWQWKKSYLPTGEAGADHGAPVYLFQVVVGCMVGHSESLTLSDTLKVKVTDPEGKAVKDMDYELSLPNGEVVTGKVDGAGTVTRENVPPGRHKITLVDPKRKEKKAAAEAKEAKPKPKYSGFGDLKEIERQQETNDKDELNHNSEKKRIDFLFPLKTRPHESYKEGSRKYKAYRNADRLHAGCDLYAKPGAEILAVADGVVSYFREKFYKGTGELAIDHADFTCRYCEISPSNNLVHGSVVKRGDVIAHVGQMLNDDGTNKAQNMLHFEMYSGKLKGALTDRTKTGGPCKRRGDLIDPTPFLEKAVME